MGTYGKREVQGFLRRGVEQKRFYGILFISMPLYGLLVQLLFRESCSILFSLVGSCLVFERVDLFEPLSKVSRVPTCWNYGSLTIEMVATLLSKMEASIIKDGSFKYGGFKLSKI